ncbi:hypothetical protein UT300005_13900 [Clostridium sp. CTA-5]
MNARPTIIVFPYPNLEFILETNGEKIANIIRGTVVINPAILLLKLNWPFIKFIIDPTEVIGALKLKDMKIIPKIKNIFVDFFI